MNISIPFKRTAVLNRGISPGQTVPPFDRRHPKIPMTSKKQRPTWKTLATWFVEIHPVVLVEPLEVGWVEVLALENKQLP